MSIEVVKLHPMVKKAFGIYDTPNMTVVDGVKKWNDLRRKMAVEWKGPESFWQSWEVEPGNHVWGQDKLRDGDGLVYIYQGHARVTQGHETWEVSAGDLVTFDCDDCCSWDVNEKLISISWLSVDIQNDLRFDFIPNLFYFMQENNGDMNPQALSSLLNYSHHFGFTEEDLSGRINIVNNFASAGTPEFDTEDNGRVWLGRCYGEEGIDLCLFKVLNIDGSWRGAFEDLHVFFNFAGEYSEATIEKIFDSLFRQDPERLIRDSKVLSALSDAFSDYWLERMVPFERTQGLSLRLCPPDYKPPLGGSSAKAFVRQRGNKIFSIEPGCLGGWYSEFYSISEYLPNKR